MNPFLYKRCSSFANKQYFSFRRAVELSVLCHQSLPPNRRLQFSGTQWCGDTTPQWAWPSGWTLVSFHKTAQFNPFIYKKNYSASVKCHVILLDPITGIIIFPFSLFSSTFSKAEEGYLGTRFLFRANPSSVQNKNSVTG